MIGEDEEKPLDESEHREEVQEDKNKVERRYSPGLLLFDLNKSQGHGP